MNVYVAAVYTCGFHGHSTPFGVLTPNEQDAWRYACRNVLESYYYVKSPLRVEQMRRDGVKVFFDSGAFSAFTKGVEIPLKDYIDYLKQHSDLWRIDDGRPMVAALDDLKDPEVSMTNWQEMKYAGVNAIPCFHLGEGTSYLKAYCEGTDYLALGGTAKADNKESLVNWLDRTWEHLVDGSGRPKLKVHGFAVTSVELMNRYPWYSVDSATWIHRASNGEVLLPGNGHIAVSNESPSRKVQGQHIDNVDPGTRNAVLERIDYMGFDLDRLREHHECRWAYNMAAFSLFGSQKIDKPFIPQYAGDLFND